MKRAMGLVAAALLFVAGVCDAAAKDFRWSNDADVFSMDPHARAEVFTFGFLNNIYEGLVQRNRDFKVEPALAASYSNPEPTRWRFEIRQGVKFHEGQALTADDVVFSFERAKLSPDMRSRVGAIKGKVTALVNGKTWTKDPRAIPLDPRTVIQLDVGSPAVPFQPVNWSGTGL